MSRFVSRFVSRFRFRFFGFRMFRIFGMYRMFRGRLFAFSLIEVMVALLVVAIIVAALAPVITKRLTGGVVCYAV